MKRTRPSAERIAQVRKDAQAKRAEIGLEPVAPGNAEYEAAERARKLPVAGRITRASVATTDGVRTWEGDVPIEAGQELAIDVPKLEEQKR